MTEKKRQAVRGHHGIYKIGRRRGWVYEIRYRARDEHGEWRQFSATFESLDEAHEALDERRASRHRGTHVTPSRGRTTFGDVAELWLEAKDRKPRTIKGYRHILESWLKPWRHRQVATLTYDDCQAIVNAMRKANRNAQTVRNVYNVMRGVLDEAVERKCIAINPAQPLRKRLPARSAREAAFLTAGEVQLLADALSAPYGLLVLTAAWSGLRAGELAGLRVRNVDPLRNRLRVEETVVALKGGLVPGTPKTEKSRRWVPVPPRLMARLQEHIVGRSAAPDDYVFGPGGEEPLNHGAFYQGLFVPAAEEIGRPGLRFHDLRHTYASLMRPHVDMLVLSRRMGHSTYRLTADTYSHLYEDDEVGTGAVLDAAFGGTSRANVIALR